ncbi:SDR family oxidoreductase [Pseudomonas aeruginosa]|nr:SDR family oxidoreductase [Pseudomonas aeruginosa]
MMNPVAVVSGAASGIGARIASELTAHGWQVVSFDLRAAEGVARSFVTDVSDAAVISAAVAAVEAQMGPITAVVANAGYYEEKRFTEIAPGSWQRMMRVHIGGVCNLMRATLPAMAARGEGAFVGIASERALAGAGHDAHYAAAKGAVLGLLRSAAAEYAHAGVRINAVAPGPTDTPLLPADSWERQADFLARLPIPRIANTDEIALAVRELLMTPHFLHGEIFSINSGTVI